MHQGTEANRRHPPAAPPAPSSRWRCRSGWRRPSPCAAVVCSEQENSACRDGGAGAGRGQQPPAATGAGQRRQQHHARAAGVHPPAEQRLDAAAQLLGHRARAITAGAAPEHEAQADARGGVGGELVHHPPRKVLKGPGERGAGVNVVAAPSPRPGHGRLSAAAPTNWAPKHRPSAKAPLIRLPSTGSPAHRVLPPPDVALAPQVHAARQRAGAAHHLLTRDGRGSGQA